MEDKREFLTQMDVRDYIKNKSGRENWVTVYEHPDNSQSTDKAISCALIPPDKIESCLANDTWDFQYGEGRPGSVSTNEGGEWVSRYYRFGNDGGIEPLVIIRDFHEVREGFPEISQEFCHFHNLYPDTPNNRFIRFDEDAEEVEVIRSTPGKVQVKLKELRLFLKFKEMALFLYYDIRRVVDGTLASLSLNESKSIVDRGIDFHIETTFRDTDLILSSQEHPTCDSLLIGKKVIFPPVRKKGEYWPSAYSDSKSYESFIIGFNEDGEEVEHTCAPETLGNNFGKNPGSPNYLTPVHFSRQVLKKYYDNAEKYQVFDSYIKFIGGGILRVDNHHEDKVTVFLGDLGRDLTSKEQKHWRHYNITPEGKGISEVNFRRSFLAEYTDATKLDFIFNRHLQNCNEAWRRVFGWCLFLPLHEDDRHLLSGLRLPLDDTWIEFESQVIALTKIVVDSLNEKELEKLITVQSDGRIGGIKKLQKFLDVQGFSDAGFLVKPLRNLQDVRSCATAHRKGSTYEKTWEKLGYSGKKKPDIFQELFQQVSDMLEGLESDLGEMSREGEG
jgi:hypothetical protein